MVTTRSPVRTPLLELWCALEHADAPALHVGDRSLSRRQLLAEVDARRAELALPQRSVVVLRGEANLEWVVTYLALHADGHVPLLAGDHADRLVAVWSPAAVIAAGVDGIEIERLQPPGELVLHPDLALLLSTSGSTGDPKLVRLSYENLTSNASAIADYLALDERDVGITSLPLHYCFGLSILHSHLAAGASVVVTDASVVDPCFAAAVRGHGVTNIAGVPHTYDLLEHAGPERVEVPSLRLLTQAGGRMAPDALDRWRTRADAIGAELIVMYGQTEATARMAYLPPELAARHPNAIGVPIPGGSFRLAPIDDDTAGDTAVGELVYRGPNVMLGYARTTGDLALGPSIDELHTGDLARVHDDGVYEIVGRRARFVKPFGLRIDLDSLQRDLIEFGESADVAVAGDDDGLAIRAPGADGPTLVAEVAGRTGLPTARIAVDTTSPIPRTESGKIDHATVLREARADAVADSATSDGADGNGRSTADAVVAVYASVLGVDGIGPDDSFVSLGGDSLSYVECSFRLETLLGRLPADWHLMAIRDLAPRRRSRWFVPVDTTVALRVAGIFAVVSTHMHLHFFPGGAHLMLAVVGYNLSRFLLPVDGARARLVAGVRTAARVAVPTILWVAAGLGLGASFGIGTLLLVNNYAGPASHGGDHWHFWFIEVFVHVTLLVTALSLVPPLRRAERRAPYVAALAVLGVCLLLRMEWAWMGDWYNLRFRTHGVAWFVALGWLVHRSDTVPKRLATAAIVVATVPGFFHYPQREWFIAGGLLLLLATRDLPVPRPLARPLVVVGSATMWIYITHFTFWPPLVDWLGVRAAYLPTIACGVGVWALVEQGPRLLSRVPNLTLPGWRQSQLGLRTRG